MDFDNFPSFASGKWIPFRCETFGRKFCYFNSRYEYWPSTSNYVLTELTKGSPNEIVLPKLYIQMCNTKTFSNSANVRGLVTHLTDEEIDSLKG